MTPRLERILTAHGSFPAAPQVLEGFAQALALAGKEPAGDLTKALVTLLEQLSESRVRVPPEIGAGLTDWAERAAGDPQVPAIEIVSLLVNAGTAGSLAALDRLAADPARAGLAAEAAAARQEHPLVPAVEKAP